MQPRLGGAGRFDLLGPVAAGNEEHEDYLCNHVPALDGSERSPGSLGIGYDSAERTRHIVERAGPTLWERCDPLVHPSFSLFTHLACVRSALAGGPARSPFSGPYSSPSAPSLVDYFTSPVVVLGPRATRTLEDLPLTEYAAYRVGLDVWSEGGCDGVACPEISLMVSGREVRRLRFDEEPARAVQLAATFQSGIAGFNGVSVRTSGGSRFEISGVTLEQEGTVNDFDQAPLRAKAGLIDPALRRKLQPMRFVGDGERGFEARLLSGEWMVMIREALAAGQRWFAEFETRADARLSCGLIDQVGAVVVEADCGDGSVSLDDTAGDAARAAFFVRNDGDTAHIDDLVLVSGAARDADEDGIPDPVDDCPEGPLPRGAQITAGDRLVWPVCTPEPADVVPLPPVVSNTCGEITSTGFIVSIAGEPIEPSVFPVPGDNQSIRLPLGAHRVRWVVSTADGIILDEPEQEIRVEVSPDARCCPDASSFDDRSQTAEPSSEARDVPVCVALGAGNDFAGTGNATDVVWGGRGNDYLSSRGGNDLLLGGTGADYLTVLAGSASLYGGPDNDTLSAVGSDGARLFGGGGADTLLGGDGPDIIVPGAGAVLVLAAGGDDVITYYDECEMPRSLRLLGGEGHDTLISPLSRQQIEALGIEIDEIEAFEVDGSRRYFSECFDSR
jgi:hypothetical protein